MKSFLITLCISHLNVTIRYFYCRIRIRNSPYHFLIFQFFLLVWLFLNAILKSSLKLSSWFNFVFFIRLYFVFAVDRWFLQNCFYFRKLVLENKNRFTFCFTWLRLFFSLNCIWSVWVLLKLVLKHIYYLFFVFYCYFSFLQQQK